MDRDAVGAKDKLVAGDPVQVDEVRSGVRYLSANYLRFHFGLGTGTQLDGIEVRWPDGKVDKIQDVPMNHFLLI